MIYIFFFILGFFLMVYSLSFIIMCFNVISIGYNFSIFVNFIFRSPSTYLGLLGFLIIFLIVIIKGDMRK